MSPRGALSRDAVLPGSMFFVAIYVLSLPGSLGTGMFLGRRDSLRRCCRQSATAANALQRPRGWMMDITLGERRKADRASLVGDA